MSVTSAFGFLLPCQMNFEDETESSGPEKSEPQFHLSNISTAISEMKVRPC